MSPKPIRIATRASNLALWQANHVAHLLRATSSDCKVELVEVSTTGDRDQTESLRQLGGFGLFTREVQKAVLDGRAELAVHSLKDLPTEQVEGLTLAAVLRRDSIFDVLVLPASVKVDQKSRRTLSLDVLPQSARVGTGSPRRRAQLMHIRHDLQLLEIRGNVETRLKKLDDGQFDALVLAEAGLRRLGLEMRITVELRPPLMYPAVGQGALGVECRAGDEQIMQILAKINDQPTHSAVRAERRVLSDLRAGCHAPLGVLTTLHGDRLTLDAVVLDHDGSQRVAASATNTADDPESLGTQVADDLRHQGADQLVEEVRRIGN